MSTPPSSSPGLRSTYRHVVRSLGSLPVCATCYDCKVGCRVYNAGVGQVMTVVDMRCNIRYAFHGCCGVCAHALVLCVGVVFARSVACAVLALIWLLVSLPGRVCVAMLLMVRV